MKHLLFWAVALLFASGYYCVLWLIFRFSASELSGLHHALVIALSGVFGVVVSLLFHSAHKDIEI